MNVYVYLTVVLIIYRLWNQLEAEIYLHRHKTIIRACRGKRLLKQKSNIASAEATSPSTSKGFNATASTNGNGSSTPKKIVTETVASTSKQHDDVDEEEDTDDQDEEEVVDTYRKIRDLAAVRSVRLRRREPKEGLGISITGGE